MPAVRFKDYYQTLGVPRTADEQSVRAAYRKLARKHHPDINPNDATAEDRFKEINEAYEVLADPAKRKMYDRFGEDWQRYRDAGFTGDEAATQGRTAGVDPNDFGAWFAGRQGGTAGAGGAEWTVFDVNEGNGGGFSDFFQTLFGRGDRRPRGRGTMPGPRRQRGQDVEVAVEVGFDEAFRGATRTFELQTPQICPTCGGTGLARDVTCPTCDGSGTIAKSKTIEVRIPPGVATGSRVRVAGQGGPGTSGAPNGDVYLRVTVRPDPRFEREGDDLRTDVDVPLVTALLGGEVVTTSPTGRVALTIPAETQPGRTFRLRRQGMPRLKGPAGDRGDLLVRANVVLPTNLTERQRDLIGQLQALREEPR